MNALFLTPSRQSNWRTLRPLAVGLCLLHLTVTVIAEELPPLGRLLTTPEQRTKLDELRRNTGKPIPTAANAQDDVIILPNQVKNPVNNEGPAPVYSSVFNGYVKRSSGPSTTWVNQQVLSDATYLSNARGEIALQLPLANGSQARLKPGQTLIISSGQSRIEEVLPNGKIGRQSR